MSEKFKLILACVVVASVFGLTGAAVIQGQVDFKVGLATALASLSSAGVLLKLLAPQPEGPAEPEE